MSCESPSGQSRPRMMDYQEFLRLSAEEKNKEILKLLPLLSPFSKDFSELRQTIDDAFTKLEELEEEGRRSKVIDQIHSSPPRANPGYHPIPDPFIISKSRQLNKRVTLNVGGVRHEVLWRMLEQVPLSRLGLLARATTHSDILKLCSDYSLVDNEFFFDRHPRSFNTILNFYRTGKLHLADEMCVLAFGEDLEYWLIDAAYMEFCCSEKFFMKRDILQEELEETAAKLEKDDEEDFGTGKFAKYQKMMWDLIEKPDTSRAAQIISVLSTIFVSISIVGMTISTLPSLQYKDARGNTIDNPSLAMVETVCIAWFTLEYFIRLAGAPQKWAFLKDGMNVVDVLAIMPFFVSLFFGSGSEFGESNEESSEFNSIPSSGELDDSQKGGMDEILQVFRIFKLARVLKLARHSPGLQAIVYTLRSSYKELGLLIFLVSISGFIFASLCYFIEIEEGSGFTSIPTAFYWVVVTMTTVGYGDIFPVTGLGKLVGTMCAISGVLVLSLPIPIIAGNFETFHKSRQKKEKAEKSKKRLEEAKAAEAAERAAFCRGELDQENFCPEAGHSSCPSNGRKGSFSPIEARARFRAQRQCSVSSPIY